MLIELRLAPGKWKLKELIQRIRNSVGLHSRKIIPHISLYGPNVATSNYREVAHIVENIALKYKELPFTIKGYDFNESNHGFVIVLRVEPSPELRRFRKELCKKLAEIAPSHEQWDNVSDEFWFHVTISLKMSEPRFKQVWERINGLNFTDNKGYNIPKPYLLMHGIRVTILNNRSKIAYEYDLVQKRVLNRREALDKHIWQETLIHFRQNRGYIASVSSPKKTKSKVYLISDLHLGHSNIIRYCGSPFADVHEMNKILIDNWNQTVKNNDTVYFLGDMCFGRNSGSAEHWLSKLNGQTQFVKGNHDKIQNASESEILEYKKRKFLLLHDPRMKPADWKGWVIHGDKHNNDIYNFPFINGENKTINISAELIKYIPLDIDTLFKLKFEKIRRMDSLDTKPIYL